MPFFTLKSEQRRRAFKGGIDDRLEKVMLNISKHFVIWCVAFKTAKFLDLYLNYLRRVLIH